MGAASGDSSTGGLWKAQEVLFHINILETAAAYFAVKIYCNHLQNTTTHLKIDNTTTVVSLNKQKRRKHNCVQYYQKDMGILYGQESVDIYVLHSVEKKQNCR